MSIQPKQSQLKSYHWKGINSSGKKVSGQTLALTELEVREKLNEQHIQIKKNQKEKYLGHYTLNASRQSKRHHNFDSPACHYANHRSANRAGD